MLRKLSEIFLELLPYVMFVTISISISSINPTTSCPNFHPLNVNSIEVGCGWSGAAPSLNRIREAADVELQTKVREDFSTYSGPNIMGHPVLVLSHLRHY